MELRLLNNNALTLKKRKLFIVDIDIDVCMTYHLIVIKTFEILQANVNKRKDFKSEDLHIRDNIHRIKFTQT